MGTQRPQRDACDDDFASRSSAPFFSFLLLLLYVTCTYICRRCCRRRRPVRLDALRRLFFSRRDSTCLVFVVVAVTLKTFIPWCDRPIWPSPNGGHTSCVLPSSSLSLSSSCSTRRFATPFSFSTRLDVSSSSPFVVVVVTLKTHHTVV